MFNVDTVRGYVTSRTREALHHIKAREGGDPLGLEGGLFDFYGIEGTVSPRDESSREYLKAKPDEVFKELLRDYATHRIKREELSQDMI